MNYFVTTYFDNYFNIQLFCSNVRTKPLRQNISLLNTFKWRCIFQWFRCLIWHEENHIIKLTSSSRSLIFLQWIQLHDLMEKIYIDAYTSCHTSWHIARWWCDIHWHICSTKSYKKCDSTWLSAYVLRQLFYDSFIW